MEGSRNTEHGLIERIRGCSRRRRRHVTCFQGDNGVKKLIPDDIKKIPHHRQHFFFQIVNKIYIFVLFWPNGLPETKCHSIHMCTYMTCQYKPSRNPDKKPNCKRHTQHTPFWIGRHPMRMVGGEGQEALLQLALHRGQSRRSV